MTELIVTTTHLHTVPNFNGRVGFCARGARAFFARHGLCWAEFVERGLPATTLLATGDAMARRLVEHARSVAGG